MGAEPFISFGSGKTMAEAFNQAREAAAYEHGHGGYTGTIAEKDGFVDAGTLPKGMNPGDMMEAFLEYQDEDPASVMEELQPILQRWAEQFDDKWGAAVGFKLADQQYVFMGWASS